MHPVRGIVLALTLALFGCAAPVRPFSEADANTNFSSFATYGWRGEEVDTQPPGEASPSPGVTAMTLQTIRESVAAAFAARGLRRAEQPDLIIDVRAGTRERLQTTFWGRDPFYDPRYGRYPVWPLTDRRSVTVVEESLVAIDVFDARTGSAIWSGIGSTRAALTAADRQVIDDVVAAILRDFPPPGAS